MGIEFFKTAIKYQEKYKKPGMQIYNTIQTNGILLNDEWCHFFRENNFLVGISIDGPQDLHDVYRRDKNDKPSFNRVMDAIRLMQEHQVEFNILATVNRVNAVHPLEVYRFFSRELNARFIQFIPVVEYEIEDDGKVNVSSESVLPEQFGDFLIDLFDEWIKNDVGTTYIQIFDAALVSWYDYPPSVCLFSPTCGTAMIIEHNGDLYSCDHFVDSKHLLGNILETPLQELVSSPKQFQFGLDKKEKISLQCRECDYYFACYGACPKHRFCSDDNNEFALNYLCPGYKKFFEHINWHMTIMSALLNQERAPAEITKFLGGNVRNLKEIFPDLSRNDPCPCRSGRKFKKCHGKPS
jgi:uncharacterized protein